MWMVIKHNQESFDGEHWEIKFTLNYITAVSLHQSLQHVQEDRIIVLGDPPSRISLLHKAIGDNNQVETTAEKIDEV